MVTWIQDGHARFKKFDLADKESYSYLLGAFHGDGNINKNSITYTIDIKNKAYSKSIKKELEKCFTGCSVYIKNCDITKVSIHSRSIAAYFSNKNKGIWDPGSLIDIDINHYLAGIIDTDGSFPKSKSFRCVITQKNKENIELLALLLDKIGVSYTKTIDRKYTNKLGTFFISTLSIYGKRNFDILSKLPYRNPFRIKRIKETIKKYSTKKFKRTKGELEKLLAPYLNNFITVKKLCDLTQCTRGNIEYKLSSMKNIIRKKINNKYHYKYA